MPVRTSKSGTLLPPSARRDGQVAVLAVTLPKKSGSSNSSYRLILLPIHTISLMQSIRLMYVEEHANADQQAMILPRLATREQSGSRGLSRLVCGDPYNMKLFLSTDTTDHQYHIVDVVHTTYTSRGACQCGPAS